MRSPDSLERQAFLKINYETIEIEMDSLNKCKNLIAIDQHFDSWQEIEKYKDPPVLLDLMDSVAQLFALQFKLNIPSSELLNKINNNELSSDIFKIIE